MKTIHNDCSFTELWVSPENWETTTAKSSLKKNWYVQCYFYDPTFSKKYPNGFPFRRKVNKYHTLEERKAAIRFMLNEIPKLFVDKGYNPITKKFMFEIPEVPIELVPVDITPDSLFLDAIDFAQSQMKVAESTAEDLKGVIKYVKQSALQLRYDKMKISEIKRKHIRFIIENLEKTEGEFSGHKFNKYRGNLQMIFSELVEFEAVESNIINDMKKRVQEKKIREVLTPHERFAVNKHLKKNYHEFWRFMILYFHSGGRIIELLRLQVKDVDLDNQYYSTLIKKGKQEKWVKRPIKNIALALWRKALFAGKSDDYVFSVGLRPGEKQIRRDQIGKRWRVHVKQKLGITSDFSVLKHLNLDETTEMLSKQDAARQAGHTNTKMVEKVYAVNENVRQFERLKNIDNKFA
ncbi:tyrosine-type recombinase/integrase [Flavobacterium sp. 25HG05S-40]|uniref:tyrosine-type recombinase/integrase n=1 Tax=Flavobacterium sp. 25HG05S-40 TaxID=3458682 RepID=UPI004044F873